MHLRLRQVVLAVLGALAITALARTAWTYYEASKVQAEMTGAEKWLRGAIVVVDPGHGGDDPGAVVRSTKEKDLVLQIGLALRDVLQEHGAVVVMTRDTDQDLGGKIREELGKRVAKVNEHGAHAYISIHANKDSCYCWGAQTFFQKGGMPAGEQLAMAVQNRLRKMTPTTRVPLSADYFVLRTSPVPAAMVEVGFLTNDKEHQRLKAPDYQKTLARAIALGLADYFQERTPETESGGSIGQ